MRVVLAIPFFLAGCKHGADVTGSVAGQSFDAGAAWWGDSFIVLTEDDYDCIDMAWVQPSYSDEDPPGDDPKRFLQFMFNSCSDVEKGVFTISDTTVSPVSASFWDYTGDTLVQNHGRVGSLQIDDKTGSDKISGTFQVSFDDGELSGTLDKIKWCTNIKKSCTEK
jgi:hypothetical protein